jgi:formylglycine-generating enzyme required for sulfatase activity
MVLRIAACLLLVVLFPSGVLAEKRIALVIGNQGYATDVGPLKNPHKDIFILGAALARVGFEILAPLRDATRDQILYAVHDMADRLRAAGPDAVGFFYYSGHGVAVDGDNFLIPVNVRSTTRRDLDVGGIKLTEIVAILNESAPQAVHFIVFDACRNNLGGIRGARGFVPVAEKPGMLIAFSTAPGATASDDGKDSGPYAAALAAELVEPGLNHSDMFFEVRTRVAASTAQEQIPWTQDGLMRRVHFGGEVANPTLPAPTQARLSEAAEAWGAAKDTINIAVLESFIARYKDTFFAELARARLDELKKRQVAVIVPPKVSAPSLAKPAMTAPTPPRCAGVEAQVGNERRCLKPGDRFKDCRTCPEMVVVPAGEFTMGSPANEKNQFGATGSLSNASEEQHRVKLVRPFAVGRFAVTRGEFVAFVENARAHGGPGCSVWSASGWLYQQDASWRSPGFDQDDRHPVVCVSWEDAKEFAAYISSIADKPYRLLTEAEREYVTRAGTTTPFWWGSSISTAQANYRGDDVWRRKTVPIDAFKANPWGLYNVHGNVREWVEDCYQDSYRRVPSDGSAADFGDCSSRVLRGGSWAYGPEDLRAASRDKNTATGRYSNVATATMASG